MAVDPNWSPVEELSFVPSNSEQIAVAAGGGIVHLVWAQAKVIYHARRADGAWSAPVKVAAGEQPSLAVTAEGVAYCAHANWFIGNREIYMTAYRDGKWALPALVSRTTGQSSDPALVAASDGKLHLAWADTTPGDSVIYYAQFDGQNWPHAPLPNGKGSRPSVAASADAVHAAWQDRPASSAAGAFDVFASVRANGGEWALPHIVSDTRDLHSLLPRLGVSAGGACHVVWQEERDGLFVIRHAERWPEGWTEPVDVSDPLVDARLARIMPNRLGQMQIMWCEGNLLKHRLRGEKAKWQPAEVACEECAGLSELAATMSDKGELHAVFTRYPNGDRHTYYLRRKPIERQKVFLPVVTR
jgi:hypothetical protein